MNWINGIPHQSQLAADTDIGHGKTLWPYAIYLLIYDAIWLIE